MTAKILFWVFVVFSVIALALQLLLNIVIPFPLVLVSFLTALLLMAITEYYPMGVWIILWFIIIVKTGDDGGMINLWIGVKKFLASFGWVKYDGTWGK